MKRQMEYIKKLFVVSIILITIVINFTKVSYSGEIILSSQGDITTHSPESVSTPEKDIPGEPAKAKSEKGGGNWLWAVAIIAVIAGVTAGAGSSSGGNDGGGTGSISVGW